MNHMELTYYRLHPRAYRVSTNDNICGVYEYLVKDRHDAEHLVSHLKDKGFQNVKATELSTEID